MINRSNNYSSVNKNDLAKLLEKKRRLLAAVSGVVLTATLMSGCSKAPIEREKEPDRRMSDDTVIIYYDSLTEQELSSFNKDMKALMLYGTNITDVSELANYENLEQLGLSYNYVTDVSSLENLHLKGLSIAGNSVQNFNIQNFEELNELYIEGNYNLYTKETLDYCNSHGIQIDITEEDVKNIESIKGMLSSLDLEGKTDLEKEKIISDFVCKHMTYDKKYVQGQFNDGKEQTTSFCLSNAVSGKGVCADYATLFSAMCQLSGINAYNISGLAKGGFAGLGNPESHEWNLVEIDGQYMLCDPTWLDQLPLEKAVMEWSNYNVDGSKLDKFKSKHEVSDIVSNLVESSDIKKVSSYESTEEKVENIFNQIDSVVENIEEKNNITRQELIERMLMGAASGAVLLVSIELSKKIKQKIEKEKQEHKLVPVKKEKKPIIKQTPIIQEPIIAKEEPIIKEVIEPKVEKVIEPTVEQVLVSLPSNDDKIVYLEDLSNKKLKEAAKLQIDLETSNGDLKSDDSEENKLNNAMEELVRLSLKPKEERALYRCKKYGYIDKDSELDKLDGMERDALEATKRIYQEVDDKVKEYLKAYLEKLKLQKNINMESDIQTISHMKSSL